MATEITILLTTRHGKENTTRQESTTAVEKTFYLEITVVLLAR